MSESPQDPHCPECGEPVGVRADYCMHCSADLDTVAAGDDSTPGTDLEAGDASTTDASTTTGAQTGGGSIEDALGFGSGGATVGEEAAGGRTAEAASSATGGAQTGGGGPQRNAGGPQAGGRGPQSGVSGGDAGQSSAPVTGTAGGATDSHRLLDPDSLLDNTLTVIVGIIGGIIVGIVGTIVLLVGTGHPAALLLGLFAWIGSTAVLVRQRTVQGAVAKSGYAVAIVLVLLPVVLAISPTVNESIGGRVVFFFTTLVVLAVPAGFAAGIGKLASLYVPDDSGGD